MDKETIVADSSPLIALALIGQLDLLQKLYSETIIPPAVWEETTIHGSGMPGADIISQINWFRMENPEPSTLKPLSILVDRGESEVISIALKCKGSTVLLDDSRARRVAERMNIKRIGTAGLLRRAKKAGLISRIRPYFELLHSKGIYMNQKLIDAILDDVGE
jgi:hypothetical protein